MIKYYARESGVRSLEKYTNRIYEKLAFKIVESDTKKIKDENSNENIKEYEKHNVEVVQTYDDKGSPSIKYPHFEVNEGNLKEYIGNPKFNRDRMYPLTPIGVSTGLA